MPSNGNDRITVTPGLHDGLGGADDFYWPGGSATIVGGDTGEAYDPNIYGTATRGGDTLTFTGIERIHLGAGADIVRGGAAAIGRYGLSIWTGAGDDQINGSRGNDTIYGGDGNDNIRWGQGTAEGNSGTAGLAYGNDHLFGGDGSDVVNLWAHDWDGAGVSVTMTAARNGFATIDHTGVTETATFWSFETVWTHQGRDTITGGAGNDLISANGDFFSMSAPGDGDADTLIFRAGHGHDTVLAFDVGTDVLDLGGRGYRATDTAAGTLLTAGQDTILLAGIHDFEV